jgi:hypothetical protein
MHRLYLNVLAGAILAATLASANQDLNLQQHLRGDPTPISTKPRIYGKSPAPEVNWDTGARKPTTAAAPTTLWPSRSHYPFIVQTVLACTWIALIASLPFIIPLIDHQPVTKTQKVIGASMLAVLFGGVYLFTNIIIFSSVHFEQERPLTVVECIYFMSQVITTVGYGDICPSKIRGQVFVGLYVIGALFIIAMLVSDVTNHVTLAADKYKETLVGGGLHGFLGNHKCKHEEAAKVSARTRSSSVHQLIAPAKPSLKPLLTSLAVFGAIDLVWIIFFSNFPGEEKTMFQAAYMSVITLSSVGLGAFTPLTEEGMIFGSFFMLFGTAALCSCISNFCSLVAKMNEHERFTKDSKLKASDHLKQITQGSKTVTQMQFFEWSVLSQKLMTSSQIQGILTAFDYCNPGPDGKVDLEVIQDSIGVNRDWTPR